MEDDGSKRGCRADSSWQLNLTPLNHHLFTCLDDFCSEIDLNEVFDIYTLIRQQCSEDLGNLNNNILINTLFMVGHKKFPEMTSVKDWFLELASALQNGLKTGLLQAFYLPRLNLLKLYNIPREEQVIIKNKLADITKAIQEDSKHIYALTGYMETKRGKSRGDSESESSDEEDADEEDEENEIN